jgi:hypothetical protein
MLHLLVYHLSVHINGRVWNILSSSVYFYQTALCHVPKDKTCHIYPPNNLKYYEITCFKISRNAVLKVASYLVIIFL